MQRSSVREILVTLILIFATSPSYSHDESLKLVCEGSERTEIGKPITSRFEVKKTKTYVFRDASWIIRSELFTTTCYEWNEDKISCWKTPVKSKAGVIEYGSLQVDRVSGLVSDFYQYDDESTPATVRTHLFEGACKKVDKSKF